MIAVAIDDERVAAFAMGDVRGEAPTQWAGDSKEDRPYFSQATLQRVSPTAQRESVQAQDAHQLLRMDSGKFHVLSGHGLVKNDRARGEGAHCGNVTTYDGVCDHCHFVWVVSPSQ